MTVNDNDMTVNDNDPTKNAKNAPSEIENGNNGENDEEVTLYSDEKTGESESDESEFRAFSEDEYSVHEFRNTDIQLGLTSEGEIFARLSSLCDLAGYSNSSNARKRIDAVYREKFEHPGRGPAAWFLSPSGVGQFFLGARSEQISRMRFGFVAWMRALARDYTAFTQGDEAYLEEAREYLDKYASPVEALETVDAADAPSEMLEELDPDDQVLVTFLEERVQASFNQVVARMDETNRAFAEFLEGREAAAYAQAKENGIKAEKLAAKLEETRERLEDAQKQIESLKDELQNVHKSSTAHAKKMYVRMERIEETKDRFRDERDIWRKRADKWGKQLVKADPKAEYRFDDLALFMAGKLDD